MRESLGLLIRGEALMTKPHSEDLRIRVVEFVESGGTVREAESVFTVGASSASRWGQRFRETGSVACDPDRGGSTSPLEKHSDTLLALIAERLDITLEEIVRELAGRGIATSVTSVWRFFERHKISYKKNSARRRARPGGCGRGARRVEEKSALA
jgi:transposase